MQRTFLAGVFLALLLAILGVYIIMRRMSFFAEGVAHASLIGLAIGVALGGTPLPYAIGSSIVVALLIYIFERYSTISRDALIGALFTVSMALGVIIISFQSGYQPELLSFLFGNILSVTTADLWIIIPLAIVISTTIIFLQRRLTALTIDPEGSKIQGVPVTLYEIFLYIAFALGTVLGVKILGVVLVSALIILPVSTSKLIAKNFKSFFIGSIIFSEITVISGLIISYYVNIPSGPSIVVFGFSLFLLIFLYSKLKK